MKTKMTLKWSRFGVKEILFKTVGEGFTFSAALSNDHFNIGGGKLYEVFDAKISGDVSKQLFPTFTKRVLGCWQTKEHFTKHGGFYNRAMTGWGKWYRSEWNWVVA